MVLFNMHSREQDTETPNPIHEYYRSYGMLLNIIVIVLLVSLIGMGAYLLGTKNSIPHIKDIQPQSNQQATTSNVSPTISQFPATGTWIGRWGTYIDENGWQIRYPSDMIITSDLSPAITNPDQLVKYISLRGESSVIKIHIEPNPIKLSLENWVTERKNDEKQHCRLDCLGFASPTEIITVGHRRGLIQYLGGSVGTVNIYLQLQPDAILWASGWTIGQPRPSVETKNLVSAILSSLSEITQGYQEERHP